MKEANIAIVEDDALIRESIQLFIKAKTHYKICLVAGSIEEFLEYDDSIIPTVLILDIGLPGVSGLEALPSIKQKYPNLDIVMLTTYQETEVIFEALSKGACSYISKRTPLPKIIEALHVVVNGGSYMSPSIARKVIEQMAGASRKIKKIQLSEKQKEIVAYIIEGDTYNQIAEKCGISVNTVRFHIKKVYSTLEINSKVELYRKHLDGEI